MEQNTINYLDYQLAIINLITDDLRINKLIHGLTATGLEADVFNTSIHETVFLLIGFKKNEQTEELKEWYFNKTEKIIPIELTAIDGGINQLSQEIYSGLVDRLSIKKGNEYIIPPLFRTGFYQK